MSVVIKIKLHSEQINAVAVLEGLSSWLFQGHGNLNVYNTSSITALLLCTIPPRPNGVQCIVNYDLMSFHFWL